MRATLRVRLGSSLGSSKSFRYVYNFEDDREHRIKVERRLPPDPLFRTALCTSGANACPPEEVSGAPGYPAFVESMADHDHHEMLESYRASFDPTAFECVATDLRFRIIKL